MPITVEWQSGDPVLVERPGILTESHRTHFQAVLNQYGYQYEMEGGQLLIPKSLARDEELLANLTEKALARQNQLEVPD